MNTIMNIDKLSKIEQVEDFLSGSQPIIFTVASTKDARYKWIQATLIKFRYRQLRKREKGVIVQFLSKITGYSRQQLTRLIKQYVSRGKIVRRQKTVKGFQKKYKAIDIVLLVKMEERHNQPNGAAVKKLCERVYHVNAVDEVTQFEVVISVSKISEHYLIPALKKIMEAFPFKIRGFHSDNVLSPEYGKAYS